MNVAKTDLDKHIEDSIKQLSEKILAATKLFASTGYSTCTTLVKWFTQAWYTLPESQQKGILPPTSVYLLREVYKAGLPLS